MLVIILGFTVHQVKKIGTYPIQTVVSGIYFLLALWSVCSLAELAIAFYAYYAYQSVGNQDDPQKG